MQFIKYSCQGNDFVLVNELDPTFKAYELNLEQVQFLCSRKMGIGSDGLLVLRPSDTEDFKMVYFNADGEEVEMCGNGARACIHAFSKYRSLEPGKEVQFKTLNGLYQGKVYDDQSVSVSMNEIGPIDENFLKNLEPAMQAKNSYFINVGVPHALFEVENVQDFQLTKHAPSVRFDKRFKNGTNVSVFSFEDEGKISLRTFERGVEDETLACGTGATAMACVAHLIYQKKMPQVIMLQGGEVQIEFLQDQYHLRGAVSRVFEGILSPASQQQLKELQ